MDKYQLNKTGEQVGNAVDFAYDEYEKGLNLFDMKGGLLQHLDRNTTYSVSGNTFTIVTPSSGNGIYFPISVKYGQTYTLKFSASGNISNILLCTAPNESHVNQTIFDTQKTGNLEFTFVATGNSIYLRFWIPANTTTTITELMLNEGSVSLPYQPYYYGQIVHNIENIPALLWNNTSPNSAQAAQSINCGNLFAYKYLVIEYKYYYSAGHSRQYLKCYINDVNDYIFLFCGNISQNEVAGRTLRITSSATMSLGDAYTIVNGTKTSDNNFIVITGIYGTNNL